MLKNKSLAIISSIALCTNIFALINAFAKLTKRENGLIYDLEEFRHSYNHSSQEKIDKVLKYFKLEEKPLNEFNFLFINTI